MLRVAFESLVTAMARLWHPQCTQVHGSYDSAGLGLAQVVVGDDGALWLCNKGRAKVLDRVVRTGSYRCCPRCECHGGHGECVYV